MVYDDDTSWPPFVEIRSSDEPRVPRPDSLPSREDRARILELGALSGYGPHRIEAVFRHDGNPLPLNTIKYILQNPGMATTELNELADYRPTPAGTPSCPDAPPAAPPADTSADDNRRTT